MCLILLAINHSPEAPLVLAANRDEFYNRPASSMDFWPEKPSILGGKDLKAGGTWFAINTSGRFAAITNYRDISRIKTNAPSRGEIILRCLDYSGSIPDCLSILKKKASQYNGFNLLMGEKDQVYWYSNQAEDIIKLPPGIHGLSNHYLNTPWPKVEKGKKALAKALLTSVSYPNTEEALFKLLSDSSLPRDQELPDTGVGPRWERILSPLFINSPTYGTRCSTVMTISHKGRIRISERSFSPDRTTPFKDRHFLLAPG